jgi:hypothetical protein
MPVELSAMDPCVAVTTAPRARDMRICLYLLRHRLQSAIVDDTYTYLIRWSGREPVMLDLATARKKQDEVKIRSSQDDKAVPRTERRSHAFGRGLTCHDMPRVA